MYACFCFASPLRSFIGFSNFVFTRELLGRGAKGPLPPLTVIGASGVIAGCQDMLAIQYPDRSFTISWQKSDDELPVTIAEDLTMLTTAAKHSIECRGCRIVTPNGDIG